jgi:hypothetical protein
VGVRTSPGISAFIQCIDRGPTLPPRDTLPNMAFDSTTAPTHCPQVSSEAIALKLGWDCNISLFT